MKFSLADGPGRFNNLAKTPNGGASIMSAVFTIGEVVQATLAGEDLDPPAIKPCRMYLEEMRGKPKDAAPICACCDEELSFNLENPFDAPQKFVVSYPNGAQQKDIGVTVAMMVAGTCPECAKLTDEEIVIRWHKFGLGLTGNHEVIISKDKPE